MSADVIACFCERCLISKVRGATREAWVGTETLLLTRVRSYGSGRGVEAPLSRRGWKEVPASSEKLWATLNCHIWPGWISRTEEEIKACIHVDSS